MIRKIEVNDEMIMIADSANPLFGKEGIKIQPRISSRLLEKLFSYHSSVDYFLSSPP